MEKWKIIKEHKPTKYIITREVSNFGNIRDTWKSGIVRIHQGSNDNGYRKLDINGFISKFSIHCLVYRYFIGEIPESYEVDHIDDVRYNNHFNNLQTLSKNDNLKKMRFNKKKKGNCIDRKDGRKKKYIFVYYIGDDKYHQAFYTKAERDELQLLYIELIQDGIIH